MSASDIIKWQTIQPFSKQTIEKIIRSVLPKRVRISDDFKIAVNRCAQIYVMSVAATAQTYYKKPHLTEDMIIEIIGLMGFDGFVHPLEQFRKELIGKKSKKSKSRKSKKIDLKVETVVQNNESSEQQLSDPKSDQNSEDISTVETEVNN